LRVGILKVRVAHRASRGDRNKAEENGKDLHDG
jgi:hypothetical protein